MSADPQRGRVVVVSGPGGVGKGTVVQALRDRNPQIAVSVSATTRPPRAGEEDGVHYHFVDRDRFMAMVDAGEFVEWAEFNGNLYGTPWSSVRDAVSSGAPVVLEIDVQGARQVLEHRTAALDTTLVFLEPPSWEELAERLRGRGSESEDSLRARLAIGREEMAAAEWFDHRIVNETVDAAVDALERILAPTSQG